MFTNTNANANTNTNTVKAMERFMAEIDKGWKSAEEGGWLTLEEMEARVLDGRQDYLRLLFESAEDK